MSGHRLHLVPPLFVVAGALLLSSCFDTTVNYQRDAESYIDKTVSGVVEATFVQVECERPIDQNVGTRFECSALDDANGTWVFDNEIIGDNEFQVNVFSRP